MNTATQIQSWTRLLAFHIALLHLENICIQLFFYYVVGQADLFNLCMGTGQGEKKLWIQIC